MGTHPIFESDFDCLTEKKEQKMASRKKQGRFENDAGTALNPVFGSHELSQLGAPFGKELTNFNLESLFREGDGAIQAKFGCAFGEFKMPMGVEMMADEVVVCNMNVGKWRNWNHDFGGRQEWLAHLRWRWKLSEE